KMTGAWAVSTPNRPSSTRGACPFTHNHTTAPAAGGADASPGIAMASPVPVNVAGLDESHQRRQMLDDFRFVARLFHKSRPVRI
ncbi:MAG: hypothetical protein ACRDL5_03040, partial [Solirubrobacteraceae bacterium]